MQNEHVVNHECVACGAGTTRPAGDLATGADTVCTESTSDAGTPPAPDAGTPAAVDAGTPAADAGATDSSAPSADGGCSVTSCRSDRATPATAGALGVLILAGLRRRRRS